MDFAEQQGKRPDVVILLQPTSPFRTAQHIREAMELYHPEIDMVVSVKETKSNPYYVLFEEDEQGYLRKSKEGSFARRQDCPEVWEYNGAIYIIKTESLKEKRLNRFKRIVKHVMDQYSSIDIDDKLDWMVSKLIVNEGLPSHMYTDD